MGGTWTISADSPPGPLVHFAINGEPIGTCTLNQWASCALGSKYQGQAVAINCRQGFCGVSVEGEYAATLDLRPQ